ncbi:MAG TPA: L,D-transpeptidase family protein [Polyangiaceae bacterium]
MTRLRPAVCALLFGCSAVVAPAPGEPPPIGPDPAPFSRVSAPAAPAPREVPAPREAPAASLPEPSRALEAPAERRAETPPEETRQDEQPALEPAGAPELVAVAREAFVHSRPSKKSPKLGYLRLGERVKRDPTPVRGDGCADGWYGVAPEGFVCVGPTASLDASNPAAELARPRPQRDDPLPYAYAQSKGVPPPLYSRLPNGVEQAEVEGGSPKRAARPAPGWENLETAPLPPLLAEGKSLPTVFGFARPASSGAARAVANSAFALLTVHEHEGRRFGLTTDLELVPLDRVNRVRASEFRGVPLAGDVRLPVGFVRSRHALLYAGGPERGLSIARATRFREGFALSGRSALIGSRRYVESGAGDWIAETELVRIDPPKRLPPWATGARTWIHVAIGAQTLVAYVGKEPVFATLVSTGSDGLADPAESRATPRGEFLVHTKHLTATMSGDEVGDEFDLRDVPYVQYWSGGYAFHAAYWHDAFGVPRSHGCVNLSPLDARWLFHFTEPSVPRGWHGAFSLRDGTLVSITE